MVDITVHKKNDVFLQVECERSIARELNDFFSYWVPEAKYMPAYKNRMWDGKIRLFDSRVNQIYVGLLDYLRDFAKKRNYSIQGGEWSTLATHKEDVESFISNLKIKDFDKTFKGIFIRAPKIKKLSSNVDILSSINNSPVMVRQGNLLGTTFHPELSNDIRIHKYFLNMVESC